MDEQVLHRLERKYFTWSLDGVPTGVNTAEVSFDRGETWVPTSLAAGQIKLLLAGPDAQAGDATVLEMGTYFPLIRITDNPEILVEGSAPIYVKD